MYMKQTMAVTRVDSTEMGYLQINDCADSVTTHSFLKKLCQQDKTRDKLTHCK